MLLFYRRYAYVESLNTSKVLTFAIIQCNRNTSQFDSVLISTGADSQTRHSLYFEIQYSVAYFVLIYLKLILVAIRTQ